MSQSPPEPFPPEPGSVPASDHRSHLFSRFDALAVVFLDRRGTIAGWSAGAERLYGYRSDEIVGGPYAVLTRVAEPEQRFQVAGAAGSVQLQEWRSRKDGALFWFAGALGRLVDADGLAAGFLELGEEATRPHMLPRRAGMELLGQVVERTRGCLLMVAADGRLLFASEGARDLFGHSPERLRDLIRAGMAGEPRPGPLAPCVKVLLQAVRTGLPAATTVTTQGPRPFLANAVPECARDGSVLRVLLQLLPAATSGEAAPRAASAVEMLAAGDAERRRIALELHDETGHALSALRIALETMHAAPGGEAQLERARTLLNELSVSLRNLSHELHPPVLEDLGLIPALRWLRDRFAQLTGIPVQFRARGPEVRLPPNLETAAFRIVQEALTNTARHARASGVELRVWIDEATVGVQVEDVGIGFPAENMWEEIHGRGLRGMRDRVRALHGRLTVDSTPGVGTRITAEFPLLPSAGER